MSRLVSQRQSFSPRLTAPSYGPYSADDPFASSSSQFSSPRASPRPSDYVERPQRAQRAYQSGSEMRNLTAVSHLFSGHSRASDCNCCLARALRRVLRIKNLEKRSLATPLSLPRTIQLYNRQSPADTPQPPSRRAPAAPWKSRVPRSESSDIFLPTMAYTPPHLDPSIPPSRDNGYVETDSIFSGRSHFDSSAKFGAPVGASTPNPYAHGPTTGALGYEPMGFSQEKPVKGERSCIPTNPTKRRLLFFGVPLLLVIVAAVVVGAVVGTQKNKSSSSSSGGSSGFSDSSGSGSDNSGSGNSDGSSSQDTWSSYITTGSGGDGSTATSDLGNEFTYTNQYGGTWSQNPYEPYSVSGQAQSFSPSLLEDWKWGEHVVRGVNLGGWLVTEPFIVPGLYERYQNTTPKAIDEYTLSQAMGDNLATEMEEHYKTFITEEDFALIAGAGLNYVRIALGYWAVETIDGEPYLPKVSWTYFVKAIGWARKYGLRILVDFHSLPGSQNGWNHSGKGGSVNFLYGVMGIANAQRSLETVRSITEYISQDGIKEVVTMIGLVNEVQGYVVGQDVLAAYYYQAYELIRGITGYGAGNGPIVLIHEAFSGVAAWSGFLSGADRLGLDQHPYLAFATQTTDNHTVQAKTVCGWGGGTNDSSTQFGITIGGEWSNAINDCGHWLDGVDSTPQYESTGTGNCTFWEEWFNWSDATKESVKEYTMANMDALQNHFFWTWKIGNSTEKGYATSPMWHYKLGLEQGWIPKDPRVAGGYCKGIGIGGNQFEGTYPSSAIGSFASTATPTIAAAEIASHSAWPPTALGPSPSYSAAQISLFPTLTQTGTRNVLATATHPANATIGGGWVNSADTTGAWVRVKGCDYPDEYDATAASVPTAVCTGS
ncbi:hypothetical protein L202_03131 [Cryptococcus amylolentus CBS 6039]|uniref:glucan 1,3-beta-glucosidase n=1 Tax=Cryptococcus amylolentus CBS 6039 TaxID=1295533 RepID=A0A1E3HXG7_9TREE|nr:hypothetical protein L202_03131 [Cryptococcus amylolentus CBS 6039]ODN81033.1 hypothetical protein L202_03131 [Cryptococcus amylolentus CBS 6039]